MSDKTYIEECNANTPPDAAFSQIGASIEALVSTISARKNAAPSQGSYTKKLLGGKLDDLLKKVSEESLEACLAAKETEMRIAELEVAAAEKAQDQTDEEDGYSSPIDISTQSFDESLQLTQAIHDCDQIRRLSDLIDDDKDHLRYEAADVVYHLLVLLARFDIPLEELAAELNARMREDERPKGCVMLHPEHIRRGK